MYLMLQNKPVLKFDISEGQYEVLEPDLLPIKMRGAFVSNAKPNAYIHNYGVLLEYLSGRILNLSRENAKKILNAYHFSQSQDVVTRAKIAIACKAVSMTDDYWLNNDEMSLKWEEMNPRENHLNEIIAHIALIGSTLTATGMPHTPELTGQGAYAKAWFREKDGMYLYKAGTKNGVEDKIEIMVSNILDHFDIDHVIYQETSFENRSVSKCKNMADDDRCIVHAEDFTSYCNRMGLNFMDEALKQGAEQIYQMCVIDYLISNSDRHGQNWGFYMNNHTGELLQPHPLYDHNNAFDEEEMKDPEGGHSLLFQGKTKKEAALYAMKKCHIRCIAPLTRADFLTEEQYESFMKRACELGLYQEQKRAIFGRLRKQEKYVPIKIEQSLMKSTEHNTLKEIER